jgi:hypothetical protein
VALDVSGHIDATADYQIGGQAVVASPGGSSDDNIALGFASLRSNTTGLDIRAGKAVQKKTAN